MRSLTLILSWQGVTSAQPGDYRELLVSTIIFLLILCNKPAQYLGVFVNLVYRSHTHG